MRHRITRTPMRRQTTARQVAATALSKIVRRVVRNLSCRLAERTRHGRLRKGRQGLGRQIGVANSQVEASGKIKSQCDIRSPQSPETAR